MSDDVFKLLTFMILSYLRSGCAITNILNNANVIIVEAYSLTEGRKDWHLAASLNFWPFQG